MPFKLHDCKSNTTLDSGRAFSITFSPGGYGSRKVGSRSKQTGDRKKRVFVEISSAFILIVAPAPAIVAESVISADLQFTNGIQRNSEEFGCVRLIPAELYL